MDFFLLTTCICPSVFEILGFFSIFADDIAPVLQQHIKPKVFPSNTAWPSCWAGPRRWDLSLQLKRSVSSLHVVVVVPTALLWASQGMPKEPGRQSEEDLRICGYESVQYGHQAATKWKENTWGMMLLEAVTSLYVEDTAFSHMLLGRGGWAITKHHENTWTWHKKMNILVIKLCLKQHGGPLACSGRGYQLCYPLAILPAIKWCLKQNGSPLCLYRKRLPDLVCSWVNWKWWLVLWVTTGHMTRKGSWLPGWMVCMALCRSRQSFCWKLGDGQLLLLTFGKSCPYTVIKDKLKQTTVCPVT